MTTLLNGLLGRALVALLATAGGSLVPRGSTDTLQRSRDPVDPSRRIRWLPPLVSVLYGSVAGGLLVVLELTVLRLLVVPPTLAAALGGAVG
jgi:hypothetical protein